MRGRPKKDGAKNYVLKVRMSKEDVEFLNYLTSRTKLSKSEIVRNGLRMYANSLK